MSENLLKKFKLVLATLTPPPPHLGARILKWNRNLTFLDRSCDIIKPLNNSFRLYTFLPSAPISIPWQVQSFLKSQCFSHLPSLPVNILKILKRGTVLFPEGGTIVGTLGSTFSTFVKTSYLMI